MSLLHECAVYVSVKWKDGCTPYDAVLQERKEVFHVPPPTLKVIVRSVDPSNASLLPNSSLADLTGCRQKDSFN